MSRKPKPALPPRNPREPTGPEPEVTRLLSSMSHGNAGAAAELMPLVYNELRALAASLVRRSRLGQSLPPTALVHEAFLKLVGGKGGWKDRAHFFGVAAIAMRHLLADHALAQRTRKRGGGWTRVTLSGVTAPSAKSEVNLEALDAALTRLSTENPRHARVVELRFLAGLTVAETAEVLGVSERTVEVDWRFSRAWLRTELEARERG